MDTPTRPGLRRLALVTCLIVLGCGREEPPAPPPAETASDTEAVADSPDDVVPGRWRPLRRRPESAMTAEQEEKARQLRAIGYAGGVTPARTNDVLTIYDPERAQPGLNLWNSGHAPIAFLMTMDGRVLHQWTYDAIAVWPELELPEDSPNADSWRRVYLYDNGDLLAIFAGIGLIKLDAQSNLLWARANEAHHDLQVLPNGDIYVLTRTAHLVPRLQESEPVLEDYLSILDADGVEKRRISMLEAFERSDYDAIRQATTRFKGDILHTNSLNLIPADARPTVSWLKPGRVLTAMRYADCVAVLDVASGRIEHAFQGTFARMHDPKLLANGNILLFDNLGLEDHSRVLEIDPATEAIVWEYDGEEGYPLSSYLCGAATRLANGNTLISETDQGRAVEVTPDGEVVWEFFNPFRVGEDPEYIATIFEMERLPLDFPLAWADHQP